MFLFMSIKCCIGCLIVCFSGTFTFISFYRIVFTNTNDNETLGSFSINGNASEYYYPVWCWLSVWDTILLFLICKIFKKIFRNIYWILSHVFLSLHQMRFSSVEVVIILNKFSNIKLILHFRINFYFIMLHLYDIAWFAL